LRRYIVIPEIVEIRSNVDYIIHFKFGEHLNDKLFQSKNNKILIEFKVTKDFEKPSYLNQRFHFIWGREEVDELYYERPLMGPIKARLLVKDFRTYPKIFVNPTYYYWLRFHIENVYPPGSHLTDVVTIKLLEQELAPIHCSVMSFNGEGVLIFGPPDMGKTITVFSSLDSGFNFLSEDIAVTDGKYVYGCPFTSTYRGGTNEIVHKLSSKFPIIGYYWPRPAKAAFEFIEKNKIDKVAKIKTVYILDRGKQSLEVLKDEEAIRRILILNRYEFKFNNPLLTAYSYFNRDLDLNKLMDKEKEIISRIVRNSKNCLVKVNNPIEYFDLIRKDFLNDIND
jgi:hypothetical protein